MHIYLCTASVVFTPNKNLVSLKETERMMIKTSRESIHVRQSCLTYTATERQILSIKSHYLNYITGRNHETDCTHCVMVAEPDRDNVPWRDHCHRREYHLMITWTEIKLNQTKSRICFCHLKRQLILIHSWY